MKKLMIAAAALAVGFAAQAASVDWYAGYMTTAEKDGGWSATLIGEEAAADYSFAFYAYTDDKMTDLVGSWTGAIDEEGFFAGSTTDVFNNESATTYYGKIVGTTEVNGEVQTLESQAFQFETSTLDEISEIYVMSDDTSDGIKDLSGKAFGGDYGAYTEAGWSSVPEPTSGLLLLIGVAGLALRRRRA